MTTPLAELLTVMQRLRGPDGCPWDRVQTFASIAPYTIEESYEVVDAIERGDMTHLKDELGDLLFQVVFHAQIAQEAGHFDFDAVAGAIRDKLIRRHPHVFAARAARSDGAPRNDGDGAGAVGHALDEGARTDGGATTSPGPATVAAQTALWEDIKARERAAHGPSSAASALDGVPLALPALMRACKLSQRAARVGFDFQRAAETADKVAEELAEVREAAAQQSTAQQSAAQPSTAQQSAAQPSKAQQSTAQQSAAQLSTAQQSTAQQSAAQLSTAQQRIFEEVGDLLFAAANLARKLGVDAEAALRAANVKFERRFHGMERLAALRGESFESLNLAAQEALWQAVKRAE